MITEYVDAIGMILCDLHDDCYLWHDWLEEQLKPRYHIFAMGQGGAAMLGVLAGTGFGSGTLIRAPYKEHGIPHNGIVPEPGSPVVLIDDIAVTGKSFKYMREWCEQRGLSVRQEVALIDLRD